MQRRHLLKLGAASAAVLVVAGGAVALWQPGVEGGKLGAPGRTVFSAVGAAILDKCLPLQEGPRQIAVNGLLDRVDHLVAHLPPHAQGELSQLLSLLDNAAGRLGLAGLKRPWAESSVVDVQAALQHMRLSSVDLKRQAYAALHDISSGAYFADPVSWPLLGYPGPHPI